MLSGSIHYYCFVLLVVGALLLSVDATSRPTTPSSQLLAKDGWGANRLLRVHNPANGDDQEEVEERGDSTPVIEKVVNSVKSAVTNDQLEAWLKKGETADDVFKLLTLDDAANNILANPHLNSWIDYMKKFNKQNPKEKASLVATLTTHYGDDGLAKIIEAAKNVPGTASMAKRLDAEQRQRWLVQGSTPDAVFKLLKLDKTGDALFSQPQLFAWVNYVNQFNAANPDKQVTLFSTLAFRYSDEALETMLIAAMKDSSTEEIASKIQAVQTKLWIKTEKVPDDVFKLLRLENEGLDLFNSPIFSVWLQYTDGYRKVHFGDKLTSSAHTLSKYYSDDVLASMILAASKNPRTASIATRMEHEMLRNWYADGLSAKDVFNSLLLPQARLKVFESPYYPLWAKYAIHLGDTDPSHKASLLTILTFIYGEGNLLKVIRAGKKVPSTEAIATNFQDELVKVWLQTKRDPTDIFYTLRVNKTGPQDPNRLLYIEYVRAYALS
uniref:PaRXLR76 n=1 Tax=Phytophthora agathidicida TaxID=1642459 RepID=A0A7G4WI65_9STRA|nr:PaRXLR76 [Phytophthora agathidicida]